MLWLRIFLSIILSVCVLWVTAIFAGAPLIQYAAKNYFGGSLKLDNIQISPRLGVYIGKVEIEQMLLLDGYSVDGKMRAVNFEWSILGRVPKIKISSGPSYLDNGVEFQ